MTPDPDLKLYTLDDAAALLGIKKRSLETERDKGALRIVALAGKHYVTGAELARLIEENSQCRDRTTGPALSRSEEGRTAPPTGKFAGTKTANDNRSRRESASDLKFTAATLKRTRKPKRSRSAAH